MALLKGLEMKGPGQCLECSRDLSFILELEPVHQKATNGHDYVVTDANCHGGGASRRLLGWEVPSFKWWLFI